jgi:acetolactate synthase-1/2/3 large subunit
MTLAAAGPVSVAANDFTPHVEVVGDVPRLLAALLEFPVGPFDWPADTLVTYRRTLEAALRGPERPGLSPLTLTRALRRLMPSDTIATTDVGAVKFIVSQAWTTAEGGTLLQSNGLSSMGFALPAAMAARLVFPDRPVLCTVGDGGFAMSLAEIETCVRRRLHFLTVVYNDRRLSLIDVIQANKGLPHHGVEFGWIDFARAAESFGAWGRRVESLDDLAGAVAEAARQADRPAVIDARVEPAEYAAHTR